VKFPVKGYLIFICIFLLRLFPVAAQESYRLQGSVQDETARFAPLSEVTVDNLSRKYRTLTDSSGIFEMDVHEGDTLRFRKLGYGTKFHYFRSMLGADNYSVHIYLHNDTIPMKPFVYKSFNRDRVIKNTFLNAYYRDSLRMVAYLRKMYEKSNRRAVESLSDAFNSPVTFLYDRFSKKNRNQKRINRYREILKKAKEENDPDYVK
jgi:hypothetical protein